jgi:hypothetical protein
MSLSRSWAAVVVLAPLRSCSLSALLPCLRSKLVLVVLTDSGGIACSSGRYSLLFVPHWPVWLSLLSCFDPAFSFARLR